MKLSPSNARIVALTLWPEWGVAFDLHSRPKRVENRTWAKDAFWLVGRTLLLHGGARIGGGQLPRAEAEAAVLRAAEAVGAPRPNPAAMDAYRGRVFGIARVRAVGQGQPVPWAFPSQGQLLLEDYVPLPEGILLKGQQGVFLPGSATLEQIAAVLEGHPRWPEGLVQGEAGPSPLSAWPWAWACHGPKRGEAKRWQAGVCRTSPWACRQEACGRVPVATGTVHSWHPTGPGAWRCLECGSASPPVDTPWTAPPRVPGECPGGLYLPRERRGALRLFDELGPVERRRVERGDLWPAAWCGDPGAWLPLFAPGSGA